MKNNRRLIRALAAILMMLALLFADIAAIAAPSGSAAAVAQTQMMAKSKKKKKKNQSTATPTVAPAETPAPAEEDDAEPGVTPVPDGPIIDPQSIADYIFANGCLPDNFITKKEAQALGWDSSYNYVSDVAPGMSLGGAYFGNYEGILPTGKGIEYREADCWYRGGKRNAYRIIYSNDGRVWYTADHYQTFTELFPSWMNPDATPIPDPTRNRW